MNQYESVDDLRHSLDQAGDEWKRLVLPDVQVDESFEYLYIEQGKYAAILTEEGGLFSALLLRQGYDNGKTWVREDDILTWLIENPPFETLVPIATLFAHSKGIEGGKSPWLLFQYVTGIAVTTQGMGLNSLMGIGREDAKYLGDALISWGDNDADSEAYLELLLMFGGEEG